GHGALCRAPPRRWRGSGIGHPGDLQHRRPARLPDPAHARAAQPPQRRPAPRGPARPAAARLSRGTARRRSARRQRLPARTAFPRAPGRVDHADLRMKRSWNTLSQLSIGVYAVQDFERAAYRLVVEQVLYASDRNTRLAYHLVEDHFDDF